MKTILKLALSVMLACIGNCALAQSNTQKEDKLIVYVGNKTGGLIEKKELIDAKKVIVKEPKSGKIFQVTSFIISRSGKGKDPVEVTAKGDELNADIINVLENTTVGDKIYFENVKIKNAEGLEVAVPAAAFVIK